MNASSLHLWFAHPDDLLNAELSQACAALLTPDEQERWQHYKFDHHKREFLATRTLLRSALSHFRPIPPAAWRFRKDSYGKPFIEPDCGLQFNVSNSDGLVVCLISEGAQVGVDVEPPTRSNVMIEVADRVFSPGEKAQLNELEGAAKLDRALTLWTLKEAYIKARGMGLSLPVEKISFLFGGPRGIRLKVDPEIDNEPKCWGFCSFDAADHRISAVVERHPTQMILWEARPLLAPPLHLGDCKAKWFLCT